MRDDALKMYMMENEEDEEAVRKIIEILDGKKTERTSNIIMVVQDLIRRGSVIDVSRIPE